ncbi:hypothetical protein [Kitasatospora aureofaciens]|uniref:hypothetical protein n=1 Tax=Kitasatospora aureofaciens TaxID=1894 RepID=UPI00380CED7B
MQDDSIRSELARRLRLAEVDIADIWARLERDGYVDDVRVGACSVEDLAALAGCVRELGPARTESRADVGADPRARSVLARTELVIDTVNSDPEVERFREEVLGGRLVSSGDIESWIRARCRAEASDAGAMEVTFRLPPGVDLKPVGGGWVFTPPIERLGPQLKVDLNVLAYQAGGVAWRLPVPYGGTLERLRALAARLAESYGWTEAETCTFVLTGQAPGPAMVRATSGELRLHQGEDHGWARRILLDIDPAATEEDVLEAWRRARSYQQLPARQRSLQEKATHLARLRRIYCPELPPDDWEALRRAWNERYPEWRYEPTQASNFRRDVPKAEKRLLNRVDFPPGPGPLRSRG